MQKKMIVNERNRITKTKEVKCSDRTLTYSYPNYILDSLKNMMVLQKGIFIIFSYELFRTVV